jgi:hypothetical protein
MVQADGRKNPTIWLVQRRSRFACKGEEMCPCEWCHKTGIEECGACQENGI